MDSLLLYKELKKLKKAVKNLTQYIQERDAFMTQELDALTLEVSETNTIMQSAVVLIQGLAAQLEAIADDPAAILQLAADLDAQSDALAAAIAAVPPLEPVP